MSVVVYKLIRNKIGYKLMQPLASNWSRKTSSGHKLTQRQGLKKNLYQIMEAYKIIFQYYNEHGWHEVQFTFQTCI